MAPRPDPNNRWSSFIKHEKFINDELNRLGKGMAPPSYVTTANLARRALVHNIMSPHITLSNLYHAHFGTGSTFLNSEYGFSEEFMGIDLPKEIGANFDVPIFLLTGSHDWHVPCGYQEEWFNSITAPYKEQIWFENSRHYPYLEEPGKYLMVLVKKVLPFSMLSLNQ